MTITNILAFFHNISCGVLAVYYSKTILKFPAVRELGTDHLQLLFLPPVLHDDVLFCIFINLKASSFYIADFVSQDLY